MYRTTWSNTGQWEQAFFKLLQSCAWFQWFFIFFNEKITVSLISNCFWKCDLCLFSVFNSRKFHRKWTTRVESPMLHVCFQNNFHLIFFVEPLGGTAFHRSEFPQQSSMIDGWNFNYLFYKRLILLWGYFLGFQTVVITRQENQLNKK